MKPKSLLATLTLMAMAAAPPAPLAAQEAEPPDTESVVEAIDVGPYEVPDLPLKKRRRYAATAEDLDPFRHVEPFQKHFLEQMEYTGPGRSIPEPEHLESVKIGFLGPIEPTVSVATGGASHGEELGIAIVDAYYNETTSDSTLSVTDLNTMAPVGPAAARAAAAVRELDQVLGVLGEASEADESNLAREIEDLIKDQEITEIMVNRVDQVFVERDGRAD